MSLFLTLGQFGLAAASADSRDRDGAFSSDTGADTESSDASSRSGQVQSRGDSADAQASGPNLAAGIAITGDLQGQRKDGVWVQGNVCSAGGDCYAEGENVPHRLLYTGLAASTAYETVIEVEHLDGAIVGYQSAGDVAAIEGATSVSMTSLGTAACGGKTCIQYKIEFTSDANGGTAEIRFNALLSFTAAQWTGANLSVGRVTGGQDTVPIPVNQLRIPFTVHKFNDLNQNGTQGPGEPDLPNWTFTLHDSNSCAANKLEGTQVTDANGNATFTAPVGWTVQETLQPGWTLTTPPNCRTITPTTTVLNYGNHLPAPNLTISKSGPASVGLNSQVTYTVTVQNTGSGPTQQAVVITDTVPAALNSVAATYSLNGGPPQACSVNGNAVSCNVGVLQPGGTAVVTITAMSPRNSCPTVQNSASAAIGTQAPITSNTVDTTVTGCAPNITLDKTGPASVALGGVVTYTISVANTGNAPTAQSVVVTDTADSDLTGVTAVYSINGAPAVNCQVVGNDVSCDLGILQPNDSAVITIMATAPANSCPPISNQAFIGNLGSPIVNTSVTGCMPNLTIDKTGPASVALGGQVTYTVTVSNIGNAPSQALTVTDTVDSDLTSVAATYSLNGGAAQACTVIGNAVSCAIGVLQPGDTAVVTITATAPANSCPPISNQAAVTNAAGASQQSPVVNTTVTGCAPNITLDKTGPASVALGGVVTYTISVANTGNAPTAQSVVVTDTVDSDLTGVTAVYSINGAPAVNCQVVGNDVSCDLGILQPNDSAVITIMATAPANSCPPISNQAFIGNLGSPIVNTSVTGCAANLTIDKTGPASVALGGQVTYTVTVTNTGTADATNVAVTDSVDADLTNVQATPSQGTCQVVGNDVTCNLGTIVPGGTATVTITATAPANSCPPISNQAFVGNTGSPIVNTSVTGCAPGMSITKSGPATVSAGGQITWTIQVANGGNADAQNVQVVDTLPAGFTFVSSIPDASGAPNTPPFCTESNGVVTCELGTIVAGASASITITAAAPLVCGPFTNTAQGTYDRLGTLGPVTASGDVVGCGGPPVPNPSLAISKTADAAIVAPGDPVGFTITVMSTGNGAAHGVTLSDPLPAIPGVTWSITGGTGAALCSIAGNLLSCNFGDMPSPPMSSYSVHVSSTPTTTDSCGTYTNSATADAIDATPVTASASVEVECPAGVAIVKDGPATAHVGETVTYAFDVSLAAGSPPLSNVSISDPICDPGTMTGPAGDDGDGVLEQGEVWSYSCTHVVTESDPDPLPNTATVCGTGPAGQVCSSDDHLVDVVHPEITVEKEANPKSGSPGEVITYTYTVTNSGDVPLYDISVDDDILGHICDIAVLQPGQTKVCTGTYEIPENAPANLRNIVIVGGTDPWDVEVRDEDEETIDVILGTTVTPTKTPPGGTAFTGTAAAIPLAGIALAFLTVGTGLLWAGRRRGRHASMLD